MIVSQHDTIQMCLGGSITVTFPSGKQLNIEATQDTADCCIGDRVLFSEEFSHGEWEQLTPRPE
jgi:hypothetical protein